MCTHAFGVHRRHASHLHDRLVVFLGLGVVQLQVLQAVPDPPQALLQLHTAHLATAAHPVMHVWLLLSFYIRVDARNAHKGCVPQLRDQKTQSQSI